MSVEIMLLGLLVVSTFTGLTTEAMKKLLKEFSKTYKPNLLAGCVSLALSVAVGISYVVLTGRGWNEQTIIYLVCLVFLAWLSAMVGYDKVIQTIGQIKTQNRKDDQDEC